MSVGEAVCLCDNGYFGDGINTCDKAAEGSGGSMFLLIISLILLNSSFPVTCRADGITLRLREAKAFDGHIYVKGSCFDKRKRLKLRSLNICRPERQRRLQRVIHSARASIERVRVHSHIRPMRHQAAVAGSLVPSKSLY